MKRCPLREIQSFEFLDEAVRAEIDKALQRNYQRIKPNSTFLELELSAEESTDAIVQYTIPAAAWKISYRLRMADEGNAKLQGFAIVDNNTDEEVLHVMSLASDLEEKQQEITNLVHETERLADRQKRLRENMKSRGQDELTSRWRNDLDAAEQTLRRIEEEHVPALRKEEKEIRARLMEAVRGLSAEWSE